ncbi:hypothetical protein M970_060100 [Encephalitozoon cuniculi EcunIII-L]|uniref:Uncharacterized protein n=1 Tax=Encephalitozoon cuniculi TaxID=6035 RepID=M1KMI8_ENCCN|nr:hypothetical protein ECU06_0160 [Encephalitozoon cuniculi]KMV65912.1 hypothetical protein M970_060100 [Encephalitozoon cuniculi EcunIII-L]UYI27600.1 hypothetical protein J0A71_07g14770 [Encephalitozoon cuniculi]
MKLEVEDIDEVMEQITRLAPAIHKEDHRFLNQLRQTIEKNTVVRPSPNLQRLAEKSDQRDLKILSLALLRRDLPLKARLEFSEYVERVKEKIKGLRRSTPEQEGQRARESSVFQYGSMMEDVTKVEESIPGIREKLKKAQGLIEDAFTRSSGKHLGPLEYAENFFSLI